MNLGEAHMIVDTTPIPDGSPAEEKQRLLLDIGRELVRNGPDREVDFDGFITKGKVRFPKLEAFFGAVEARWRSRPTPAPGATPYTVAVPTSLLPEIMRMLRSIGVPASVADCKPRFEVSTRAGALVFSARDHPSNVLRAAFYIPEGDYAVKLSCSCPQNAVPVEWGRLSNYGDGLAVIHGPQGEKYCSEKIDLREKGAADVG